MTTRSRPPIGPLLSISDGAGRSSEWVHYTEGEPIGCPGLKCDRRDIPRGDRRSAPRLIPCSHKWGRVQRGCSTKVRVYRDRVTVPEPVSLLLWCGKCQCTIEFKTHAASNEAA